MGFPRQEHWSGLPFPFPLYLRGVCLITGCNAESSRGAPGPLDRGSIYNQGCFRLWSEAGAHQMGLPGGKSGHLFSLSGEAP